MLSRTVRNAILCYVYEPWGSSAGSPPTAYFTTQPLDKQWGDDWNDAPYDCNAGIPYRWDARRYTKQPDGSYAWVSSPEPSWQIFMVEFTGPFETPRGVAFNTPYSVEMINDGKIPWLWTDRPARNPSHHPGRGHVQRVPQARPPRRGRRREAGGGTGP